MTTISCEGAARAVAPTTKRLSAQPLLRFLREQRVILTASLRAARAYEQADSVAAQREALRRLNAHLRS